MSTPPGTIKRSKGIGGSDVAALCGLSKYKTAYQLYLEKRGEIAGDDQDSEILRFGRRLEKPIADEFAFRTGRKIWRQRRTLRVPKYKFLLANIDRWQERDGIRGVYEGKNANWLQRKLWLEGGVPEAYYLQLQHYLLVTGCTFGTFGVLFGGNEFHAFDVERDEATIAMLLPLEIDFWERVRTGNPPDFAFGEAGAKLIKRMHQQATPSKAHLFAGTEAEAKIRRYLRLCDQEAEIGTRITDLETWIKLQMADAETALLPGVAKFTWKNGARKSVDLDRLKREYPAIATALTRDTPTRTFRSTALTDNLGEAAPEDRLDEMIITAGVRQIELE
jgi:putative phage-type endonuclease